MDTVTIRKLLKTYKCFKGVYASDQLPYQAKLPIELIVNTDPSDQPGQHWVCISIDSRGRGYYFDSFGLPPLVKDIHNFLNEKTYRWSYNRKQIQNVNANTCGLYCVLYIIFKCIGLTHRDFITSFGRHTHENEVLITKIFKNFTFAKKLLKSKDGKKHCRSN